VRPILAAASACSIEQPTAKVDFLISPTDGALKGGEIKHLCSDLGAVVTPGLHLAFADEPTCLAALDILRNDFADADCIGPRRAAEFLERRPDDDIQQDVVGHVQLAWTCLRWCGN
jgi:hypothetical protein